MTLRELLESLNPKMDRIENRFSKPLNPKMDKIERKIWADPKRKVKRLAAKPLKSAASDLRIRWFPMVHDFPNGVSICIALTDGGRYELYISEDQKARYLHNDKDNFIGYISGPKHEPYESDGEAVYNLLRAYHLDKKVSAKARETIKNYINNNNTWYNKKWYNKI